MRTTSLRTTLHFVIILATVFACQQRQQIKSNDNVTPDASPVLYILGITQDAGYPQLGCTRSCCRSYWDDSLHRVEHHVASLGIFEPSTNSRWLIEATPDIKSQWHYFSKLTSTSDDDTIAGIFLTHAHIGHYLGLAQLGFESMNAQNIPVYAMPRMKTFLTNNGPWSQLVKYNNINIEELRDSAVVNLTHSISVTAFTVPHRDEFSETVGFRIAGKTQSAVFIPDIDKWSNWTESIEEIVINNDYVFIDGTFYDGEELPNRDIAKVPHPFITETMTLLANLPSSSKGHVYFIHFNHTNPVLRSNSEARKAVESNGFHLAEEGMKFLLK